MPARLRAHVSWAALVALLAAVPAGAGAETTAAKVPAPVIIVLDVQAALQQSTAARQARAQRDKYLQTFQSESEETRKALKASETDLVKQKATLSPENWQQKARAFERQVYQFNQRFQKTNQAVERSFRTAMAEVSQALAQVAEEVASDKGANLVLPKSQIFLHDPRMEVTEVVIQRLNAKYPSVPFPEPQPEEGAVSSPAAAAQPQKK